LNASAGLAFLAAGYAVWVRRRNRRLHRPAIRSPDSHPYRSRRFSFSDGAEVTYLDAGHGSPVVLIPGADGMKETFRHQIPTFERSHRVISADLRDRTFAGDTFDRLADDVAELMDETGVQSAVILGQSLGGSIAMRFATSYPERVRGLVISNSLTHMNFEHVGFNRTGLIPLARFTTRYLPTAASRLLAELWSRAEVWIYDDSPGWANIVEYALWTGPRTVSSFVSRRRVDLFREVDLRAEIRRIRTPTLVVRGDRDFYMPPGWWKEVLDAIPEAVCREITETGHCSHISMPGSFNQTILDWIGAVERGESTPVANQPDSGRQQEGP
jgi:pimeloyl-ACP methyl ester carboxylesterase